jgi:hypothetical protein
MEPVVILSHFHRKRGPTTVYAIPQTLDAMQLFQIAKNVEEMEHRGRFISYPADMYAINFSFEIQSQRPPFSLAFEE